MIRILPGAFLAMMCLTACGSNQALLAERGRGEASHLQAYCKRAGVDNGETRRADASLASAAKHLKDGDEAESAAESDLAVALYRLALARKDLADAQAQVGLLRTGLARDMDQLQTYQEILSEMKAVRKP